MKNRLYIIGAGSVGVHVALNINEYSGGFEVEGFFDDDPGKIGTEVSGFKVLGSIEEAADLKESSVAIGIAFPKVKKKILQSLSENESLSYPALIHRRAWISRKVSVGRGSIIYPGTTINFGCGIADFVIINANCSLGHDTFVGSFSSFAPGVNTGGHSHIGEAVEMGIGSSTLQEVRIGAGSIVGGQSMVIHEIAPASRVAGVPARRIT